MSTINKINLYDWQAWIDLAPNYDWDGLVPPSPGSEAAPLGVYTDEYTDEY